MADSSDMMKKESLMISDPTIGLQIKESCDGEGYEESGCMKS